MKQEVKVPLGENPVEIEIKCPAKLQFFVRQLTYDGAAVRVVATRIFVSTNSSVA